MFGARHRFRVCTGARYLGGYIGDDKSKRDWLRERTLTWERNINKISKSTGKYPQESYAALVHAIQSDLKRVIPNITQPWYDDNARDLGKFVIIDTYFDFLTCQGTGRGYHLELS